jgi:hypothetical protein
MKSIILKAGWIAVAICTLSSCSHVSPRIVNLTPTRIPTNSSGIYTLSMLAADVEDPVKSANLVIGGKTYPMSASGEKQGVFTFDYALTGGINRAKYYFEIFDTEGKMLSKSDIYDLSLTNRYVVELDSLRGQPGSSISVLGRGFRAEDRILFGTVRVTPRYISEKLLEFDVPSLEGGSDYQVALSTDAGDIVIGTFRVDFSELRSVPSRLVLLEGQSGTIVFNIDREAPAGGMSIDVQVTPFGLLEYEPVQISEGTRSVNLQVFGGAPGKGTLLVSIPAHNRLEIPVKVESRNAE